MKRKSLFMGIIAISLILTFTACNKQPTHDVTFDSNGGSTIEPIKKVKHGSTIQKPEDPTNSSGAITRFEGWYIDNETFTRAFDFTHPITESITLYAKWGGYKIGDTGPAGGIIFYVNHRGFTYFTSATDTTGTTAYYLEAAPENMSTTLAWASSGFTNRNISGTKTAIGTGMRNTLKILAVDENAPAAKASNNYSGGGKSDWFLPSGDELYELYINRSHIGNDLGTPYSWSSSQSIDGNAWGQHFANGGRDKYHKSSTDSVRAVRAF